MLLNIAPNELGHNRYGFISSKGLGNAVVRNRTRRLLREATRHHHLQLRQSFDVILIARQRIVGHTYHEIVRHLGKLYEQAGLLQKEP
jgi:ribonuclease P protein component